jgi:hypothetical protein
LVNIFEFVIVPGSLRIVPVEEFANTDDLHQIQELGFHELLPLRSVCRRFRMFVDGLLVWYDRSSQVSGEFKFARANDCLVGLYDDALAVQLLGETVVRCGMHRFVGDVFDLTINPKIAIPQDAISLSLF